MPFRDHRTGETYQDFKDCKQKNRDKRSPGGYCATAKRITEQEPDIIPEQETNGFRDVKREFDDLLFGR